MVNSPMISLSTFTSSRWCSSQFEFLNVLEMKSLCKTNFFKTSNHILYSVKFFSPLWSSTRLLISATCYYIQIFYINYPSFRKWKGFDSVLQIGWTWDHTLLIFHEINYCFSKSVPRNVQNITRMILLRRRTSISFPFNEN